jgi:hypothetical protein
MKVERAEGEYGPTRGQSLGVLALTGAKPPNKLERRGSDGFVLSCAAAREFCQALQLAAISNPTL